MVPKIIHLCWFSNDPYPIEIKVCLESWKRIVPDYEIKLWGMAEARAIGIPYINEALDARRWAFAGDVVRFYAVWKYGGVYMDSDVFLYRRFDEFLPKEGEGFSTFHEKIYPGHEGFGLQAAFFMGEKSNDFCREMVEYYASSHFILPDGSQNTEISPFTMRAKAVQRGYESVDVEQRLPGLTVYPTHFLAPRKRYDVTPSTVGQHRVYGSWRKRKIGRRIEIALKHYATVIRYALLKR
ncbi:MAG: glycosyltransferase [Muribaculaceae bacterium]|nr:glycosyltransferase [Muribaculaceae bacterium]